MDQRTPESPCTRPTESEIVSRKPRQNPDTSTDTTVLEIRGNTTMVDTDRVASLTSVPSFPLPENEKGKTQVPELRWSLSSSVSTLYNLSPVPGIQLGPDSTYPGSGTIQRENPEVSIETEDRIWERSPGATTEVRFHPRRPLSFHSPQVSPKL